MLVELADVVGVVHGGSLVGGVLNVFTYTIAGFVYVNGVWFCRYARNACPIGRGACPLICKHAGLFVIVVVFVIQFVNRDEFDDDVADFAVAIVAEIDRIDAVASRR